MSSYRLFWLALPSQAVSIYLSSEASRNSRFSYLCSGGRILCQGRRPTGIAAWLLSSSWKVEWSCSWWQLHRQRPYSWRTSLAWPQSWYLHWDFANAFRLIRIRNVFNWLNFANLWFIWKKQAQIIIFNNGRQKKKSNRIRAVQCAKRECKGSSQIRNFNAAAVVLDTVDRASWD